MLLFFFYHDRKKKSEDEFRLMNFFELTPGFKLSNSAQLLLVDSGLFPQL